MSTYTRQRAYLELHIAVFLFGITAILGDLISLSALMLVWWRVLVTALSLVPFSRIRHHLQTVSRRQIWIFVGIGAIVALHWLTFYGAVKLANASIALVCMATTSFFTAILEPLLLKRPFQFYELLLGLLIVPGMFLVVNGTTDGMLIGIWVGVLSALSAAVFAILNKKYIETAGPIFITFVEMVSVWVTLSLLIPFIWWQTDSFQFWPQGLDWPYLLLLSLGCTTLAYVLSLRSLVHMSAFASNLTINLEPVYGIALAWILLGDHKELAPTFYWGVVIILAAVFAYPMIRRAQKRKEKI